MLRINGRTFYAILKDSEEKDIALWGKRERTIAVCKKLGLLHVNVRWIITEHPADNPLGIEEISQDALGERVKPNDAMIVLLQDDYDSAAQFLMERGFRAGWDFRWVKRYGMDNIQSRYMFDPMLGFNTIGSAGSPGFYAAREPRAGDKRIVVMGGSSPDPGSMIHESWTNYLQDMLEAAGGGWIAYNGGVMGYSSGQVMVKLMRDAMALKPELVIDFTGNANIIPVNKFPFMVDYNLKLAKFFENHEAPTVNMKQLEPFVGMCFEAKDFDRYEYWLNHLKTMRYFCTLNGVPYFAFLTPNLLTKREEKLLPEEREYLLNRSFMGRNGLTPQAFRTIARGFGELLEKEPQDWLFDLTDIFDNEATTVYEDGLHFNERGNRLVAQAIFDSLKKVIDFSAGCDGRH